MNVAIFTDNDFDRVSGITTTLAAALRCAPADLRLRIYTASTLSIDTPDYLALRSFGVPIPFSSETCMYVPRLREYLGRARADRIDVIHLPHPVRSAWPLSMLPGSWVCRWWAAFTPIWQPTPRSSVGPGDSGH